MKNTFLSCSHNESQMYGSWSNLMKKLNMMSLYGKKTFRQLSHHQPFQYLYLIGRIHQIFQKKRKTVQVPRMKCKFVALLPPFYCELKIVHFWLNFGTKALK